MFSFSKKIKYLVKFFFIFLFFSIIMHLGMKYVFNISGKLEILPYIIVCALFVVFCNASSKLDMFEKFCKEKCLPHQGVIYFYERPYSDILDLLVIGFVRRGPYYKNIFYNKKLFTRISPDTYSVHKLSPGKKTFFMYDKKLDLHIQAGHSYFIKIVYTFLSYKFLVVPEKKALSEISFCCKRKVKH